jgi:phosphomannomutase
MAREKENARERYAAFSRRVVSQQSRREAQERFFSLLSKNLKNHPLGIVAELNGSARTLSMDEEFLTALGFRVKVVNGKPRQITHRIVPEGESLNLCREELEKAHGEDPSFVLGYVPDNDGDRGNLVYYDDASQSVRILQAQEVFALAVLGELGFSLWMDHRGWSEEPQKPLAVAVNGPTSLRIEAVARPFGATVFRAEVGEANVVNRAREARSEGYRVPILGEGSNGGNITHPAAVRDPLNTLFALAKLLLLRDTPEGEGLYHLWCKLSVQEGGYHEDFTLTDVISTLPSYTSTSAYEPEAVMPIKTLDHAALKASFESLFPESWEKRKEYLKERWQIVAWRQINSEGTVLREGVGPQYRTGAQKGGLKVELLNGDGEVLGFLWMRGSGTEPVFRVAAEIKGDDPEGEKNLLEWLRDLVERC